eukprot:PhM_4_TR1418/c0_g1_i1/m.15220/K07198/PRKAA, AMPK; 5'-AMP-activated protein kinase, catalytic alpha subunit
MTTNVSLHSPVDNSSITAVVGDNRPGSSSRRVRGSPYATTAAVDANGKPQLRLGPYLLSSNIGKGSFGKVKLATHHATQENVAIKMISNSKISNLKTLKKIHREVKILKLFHHPHIVRLYDVIPSNTDVFLVTEYCSNGELYDHIVKNGKLPEATARKYFQQIISGVEYCHHFRVVHRDLKPENLLLDANFNVKIIDFGLSNLMRDGDFLATSCGSPNYAAPEVISGKLYAGPEVDVWSCGVILFALLCGHLPFDEESIPALFTKIRKGIFTIPSYVSAEARDLLLSILQVDPLKRVTISQIRAHAWFTEQIPPYLEWEPHEFERTTHAIDEEIVAVAAARMNVTPEAVRSAVVNHTDGDVLIAYHLLRDHKAHDQFLRDQQSPRQRSREGSVPPGGQAAANAAMLGTSPVMHTMLGHATMKQAYNSGSCQTMPHANNTTTGSLSRGFDSGDTQGVGSRVASQTMRPNSVGGVFSVVSPSTAAHSSLQSSLINTPPTGSFRGGTSQSSRTCPGSVLPIDAQFSADEITYYAQQRCGWRLGCMTDLTSQQVIQEVYSALLDLGYVWRSRSPFAIVCKHPNKHSDITINIAVYRMHDKHERGYVLDFALASGSHMVGLDLLGDLYNQVSARVG